MRVAPAPTIARAILTDAMFAVMFVRRDHSVVRIEAEATRLLNEHPGSPVSRDELKAFLMRFALRQKVPIDVG